MPSLDELRRKHPEIRDDYTIDQHWERYGAQEHGIWRTLFEHQAKVLPGRACREFLDGLSTLELTAGRIPQFERLSDSLENATGWRIVAVPSLVPDAIFFDHLANRRFPAGQFIRRVDQLDYIEEPDVFHDVFGHVPMLAHPVFADYMQAYGKGKETETTMNEEVPIGAFLVEPGKKGFDHSKVLFLSNRRVHEGKQTIHLVLDQAPLFAGIDPYNEWIDRNSDDNVTAVAKNAS